MLLSTTLRNNSATPKLHLDPSDSATAQDNLRGGGIYTEAAIVILNGTDISSNVAAFGGGLYWLVRPGRMRDRLSAAN